MDFIKLISNVTYEILCTRINKTKICLVFHVNDKFICCLGIGTKTQHITLNHCDNRCYVEYQFRVLMNIRCYKCQIFLSVNGIINMTEEINRFIINLLIL